MNLSPDLHATRRRSELRKWAKRDVPTVEQYVREKDADTGSSLPAILAIALVCVGIAAGIALWGNP